MSDAKPRIGIVIDQNLLDWIDKEIESKHFANRSHAIQVCVFEAMKRGGSSD